MKICSIFNSGCLPNNWLSIYPTEFCDIFEAKPFFLDCTKFGFVDEIMVFVVYKSEYSSEMRSRWSCRKKYRCLTCIKAFLYGTDFDKYTLLEDFVDENAPVFLFSR